MKEKILAEPNQSHKISMEIVVPAKKANWPTAGAAKFTGLIKNCNTLVVV